MLYSAATRLYSSETYKRRGEFGELLLHALLVDFYGVEPLLSKIQFKTATNMPVHGFDSVHIAVSNSGEIKLWLGESKLYKDVREAIRDAVSSLVSMVSNEKLREEFAWFVDKIDQEYRHREKVLEFININTSLDKIKPNLVFPVLITYDSETIGKYTQSSNEFISELLDEAQRNTHCFRSRVLTALEGFTLKLIFMPVKSAKEFRKIADAELKRIQQLG